MKAADTHLSLQSRDTRSSPSSIMFELRCHLPLCVHHWLVTAHSHVVMQSTYL